MISGIQNNEQKISQYGSLNKVEAAQKALESGEIVQAAKLLLKVKCTSENSSFFFKVVMMLFNRGNLLHLSECCLQFIQNLSNDLFQEKELLQQFVSTCTEAGHLKNLAFLFGLMEAGSVRDAFFDLIAKNAIERKEIRILTEIASMVSNTRIQEAILLCFEEKDLASATNIVSNARSLSIETILSMISISIAREELDFGVELLKKIPYWCLAQTSVKEVAEQLYAVLPEEATSREWVFNIVRSRGFVVQASV
jgi:hypothetical protein